MRREINKLITIRVSSIIKAPLLYSLATEAKLIQVTSTVTKHANKSFLSWLGGFFPYLSLGGLKMALDWMGSEFWWI
jgi:hypothetical protein